MSRNFKHVAQEQIFKKNLVFKHFIKPETLFLAYKIYMSKQRYCGSSSETGEKLDRGQRTGTPVESTRDYSSGRQGV